VSTRQRIFVDDNGLVWDVTDQWNPVRIIDSELELTDEDKAMLMEMGIAN
jgi:hypothetical protein